MKDVIKTSLKQMSKAITDMANFVYQGLMENDAHYLNSALNKERIIDDLEKEVTANIIQGSKAFDKKGQKEFVILGQTAQNIERMGDEFRSLIERIEIKVAEKLLFSELGIEQYKEVFEKMRRSLDLTMKFLDEEKIELLDMILKNGDEIKELIEKYRTEHMKRLAKGICEPRAANMYFDMLDFTGNIARHCTNIARAHKEQ
ncbi:MAG: Na/Pi cotransporter family protein [Candidatus Omnitrophota bacterium]|nr:MAG: Na/Pi cotransporter family protein [Candidatus Omnitrophota bacterium]